MSLQNGNEHIVIPEAARSNIFVLCTGRSGSTTFARSMAHATNYSSAHESRSHHIGAERLNYPPRHIEADNRLTWILGRLDRAFGSGATYVHLKRDTEVTARSLASRSFGIMRAYSRAIVTSADKRDPSITEFDVALDLVDTINSNIEMFLRDKPYKFEMTLEGMETQLPHFWSAIGAEGDLDAATAEWTVRHNARDSNCELARLDPMRPSRIVKPSPKKRSLLQRLLGR